jgi:Icc-related predicted phosphoesterase
LKILVTADFHGASNGELNLLKFLEKGYDCALLIGDLTNFGPPEVADGLLQRVKELGVAAFSVPGNCDPKQVLQILDKYDMNLHRKCRALDDVTFVGLGGSNLTPFNTPFELTEVEIQEELAAIGCNKGPRWVLVTHAPPFDTALDKIKEGVHVGSKSIRSYVESQQPSVLVCGHVHEARGIDRLGQTVMINPGQITKGFAAEVSISNKREVQAKLIEL